jgi:hypothetical protein
MEPATTASRGISERTTEKRVSHDAERRHRMLVGGFRVTWDTILSQITIIYRKLVFFVFNVFSLKSCSKKFIRLCKARSIS